MLACIWGFSMLLYNWGVSKKALFYRKDGEQVAALACGMHAIALEQHGAALTARVLLNPMACASMMCTCCVHNPSHMLCCMSPCPSGAGAMLCGCAEVLPVVCVCVQPLSSLLMVKGSDPQDPAVPQFMLRESGQQLAQVPGKAVGPLVWVVQMSLSTAASCLGCAGLPQPCCAPAHAARAWAVAGQVRPRHSV